jgi:hypothetical protein
MHLSPSLFYLTTALHVSGVTVTHLQERKTQNDLSVLQHTQISSNSSTIAADNSTV